MTFGPLGRVVCTVVLLGVPVCLVLYGGLFGVAGLVPWCGWILPWALRDTWRRAALPPTELTLLRDGTARRLAGQQEARQHLAFDPDFKPPTRW